MTGLSINVTTIILTVAFALFAFVFAFLISSLVSKDKIASDKRLEELKKNEGDSENYSLAKHESRMKKRNREKKKQGRMEVGKYLESYEFAERSAQVWV
mgnify:CR=1 FL=1